jgi:hypothetical protein
MKLPERFADDERHGLRLALNVFIATTILWLSRLITRCVPPEDFVKALERQREDIKVVIQFSNV